MSTAKSEFAALRKTKRGIVFMIVTGAVLLALILWALISFGISVAQKRDLIEHGLKTSAIVTAKDSDFVILRGGGFNSYNVDYRFTVGSHMVTKHDVEISYPTWKALSKGSKLDIVYKANDPSDNQPISAVTRINPLAGVVIYFAISLFLLFGISALIRKYVPAKKQKSFLWFIAIVVGAFYGGFWITIGISQLISLLFL